MNNGATYERYLKVKFFLKYAETNQKITNIDDKEEINIL